VTSGPTYENAANLADTFIHKIVSKYEGTRLGRQELYAEILDDTPGALWTRDMIDRALIRVPVPKLARIVVAIDPAVSNEENSDETGIIVMGLGTDHHGYVLQDASGRYSPTEWAREAIRLYKKYEADRIVAEVNNGGDMVEATLRVVDANVSYLAVHASRGKVIRAEPVSALYERNMVHHVGSFPKLEDQMSIFTADFDRRAAKFSPDRLDALVWAASELMVEDGFNLATYLKAYA
jgi:predicted phage terminase large subunit-like protein